MSSRSNALRTIRRFFKKGPSNKSVTNRPQIDNFDETAIEHIPPIRDVSRPQKQLKFFSICPKFDDTTAATAQE